MALKPRINIFDTDYTTISGQAEDVLDIAFVPGFASKYAGKIITEAPANNSKETASDTAGPSPLWDTAHEKKYVQTSEAGAVPKEVKAVFSETPATVTYVLSQDVEYNSNHYIWNQEIVIDPSTLGTTEPGTPDAPEVTGAESPYSCTGGYALWYTQTDGTGSIHIKYVDTYDGNDWTVTTASDVEVQAFIPESDDATDTSAYYSVIESSTLNLYTLASAAHTDYVTGYWYEELPEEDYDGIKGVIVRYDTLAQFTAAVGNEPCAVWNYADKGTTTASFLSLYDYAASIKGSDPVEVAQYVNELVGNDAISIGYVDRNWIYAAELLAQGFPVYYCVLDYEPFDIEQTTDPDGDARAKFITAARDMYAELADKGEYNIKYLTTGTFGIKLEEDTVVFTEAITESQQFLYPFYEVDTQPTRLLIGYLSDIANYRKDAIVLADALESQTELDPGDSSSAYYQFNELVKGRQLVNFYSGEVYTSDEQAKMGRRDACTFPWYKAVVNTVPNYWKAYLTDGNRYIMPGSFAYLISLATSIQKYESASWEAIAGVTRALVPNFVSLNTTERLSNAIADAYNKRNAVGINAITNIRPYGYCIWGNRTLVDNEYFSKQGDGTDGLIASSFVDIMSMVCNVNKIAYRTCKRLMFEKDNDVLWIRFRQGCDPYLDQLLTAGALRTYTIEKLEPTMRGQLVARITLWCTYSVENFDIEIALRDPIEAEA